MTDEPLKTEEIIADAPPARRKPVPLRMKVLLGMLALLGVTFGVNATHVQLLENELQAIADAKESEWARNQAIELNIDTATIVTATKEFLVYGDVNGKIEVFVKDRRKEGRYVGIDYFFSRNDGDWTETESGVCTDAECQIRGAKAFAQN